MGLLEVSIVSHGQGAELLRALKAFSALDVFTLSGARVWVTLNIPEPSVARQLQQTQWPFELRLTLNVKPLGFGVNHNQAFARARRLGAHDWFVVMNPDVLWPDNASSFLRELSDDSFGPSVGLVCLRQLDEQGQYQDYARNLPTPWRVLGRVIRRLLKRVAPNEPPNLEHADWVNGACMVWRSEVFAAIGGFDERYFMYCEDVDICLRMQIAGFRMVEGNAAVVHLAQRKTLKSWKHLAWHICSFFKFWCSAAFWRFACRAALERQNRGAQQSGKVEKVGVMVEQKKHLYEYTVDPASLTAGAFVVEFVGSGKRVLEVGCGPGSLTRVLYTERQCKVTGIELDPDAIEKATPYCEVVIRADLNDSGWLGLVADQAPFDVVVAADVLEHLHDPWKTLERMAGLVTPEGFLVISLPHACHAAVICCLVDGDVQYRDWGLLDRTHIRFFGLENMVSLIKRAGLKIIDYRFVMKPPEETEFADRWARLPRSLRQVLGSVPHANIYQVVIKAVPSDRIGAELILVPPRTEEYSTYSPWRNRIWKSITRRLAPHPRVKNSARRLLGFLGIKP